VGPAKNRGSAAGKRGFTSKIHFRQSFAGEKHGLKHNRHCLGIAVVKQMVGIKGMGKKVRKKVCADRLGEWSKKRYSTERN